MKLRTLVFSGCGTRIIGHAGFLKCIEGYYNLSEVNTFAGTSVIPEPGGNDFPYKFEIFNKENKNI